MNQCSLRVLRSMRTPLVAVVLVVFLQGCAWQRVPVAPTFAPSSPIPVTLGVELSPSPVSSVYGPRVVGLLSQMMVVDTLVYPYREDDTVDALLNISLDGSWRGSGVGAGIAIGLTFGLLSPFIGPSIVGTHDVRAALTDDDKQVAIHSAHIESKLTWGLFADANAVGLKADDLQTRKIAVSLGEWLQANRAQILESRQ